MSLLYDSAHCFRTPRQTLASMKPHVVSVILWMLNVPVAALDKLEPGVHWLLQHSLSL
jgi:hypothetical protein